MEWISWQTRSQIKMHDYWRWAHASSVQNEVLSVSIAEQRENRNTTYKSSRIFTLKRFRFGSFQAGKKTAKKASLNPTKSQFVMKLVNSCKSVAQSSQWEGCPSNPDNPAQKGLRSFGFQQFAIMKKAIEKEHTFQQQSWEHIDALSGTFDDDAATRDRHSQSKFSE